MRKLQLRYSRPLAPGDYVVLTSLVRDIQACYPGQFRVGVETNFRELFQANPHVSYFPPRDSGVEEVTLDYQAGMTAAGQGEHVHFTNWLYRDFNQKTGLAVRQLKPHADLYLPSHRQDRPPVSGRYWLVMAGGKSDVTVKHWDYEYYQHLVDQLQASGIHCVQTGSAAVDHTHLPLQNCLNLVGWGGLSELVWQIAFCEGIICPITCGMHIAAAFQKPCVVIAGGREEPWWEAYDNKYGQFGPDAEVVVQPHKYLHSVGQLDCCQTRGCWVNKVLPTEKDKRACTNLAKRQPQQQPLPLCMDSIRPSDVARAVWSYYLDGTLPLPVQQEPPQRLDDKVPWHSRSALVQTARRARQGLVWLRPKLARPPFICIWAKSDNFGDCVQRVMDTVPLARSRLFLLRNNEGLSHSSRFVTNLPVASTRAEALRQACQLQSRGHLIWIDSDCQLQDDQWFDLLGESINRQTQPVALWGYKQVFEVTPDNNPAAWLRRRSWYRQQPFANAAGIGQPGGRFVPYCDLRFWAARYASLHQAAIPTEGLRDNCDVAIGLQLQQAGLGIVDWGRSAIVLPTDDSHNQSTQPWQVTNDLPHKTDNQHAGHALLPRAGRLSHGRNGQ